jgi:hypothetical protein
MDALEARVQRLAGQVAVSEALFGTIAALALRTLSDDVRDTTPRELRACITASVKGSKPSERETLTLQVEEHAAQLLDQIERLARLVPSSNMPSAS